MMQRPRRSILTGQPLDLETPAPPPDAPQPARASLGPVWLLGLALLLLLSAVGVLFTWQLQPGALPFVPRTVTPTPRLTATKLSEFVPIPTAVLREPTQAPNINPFSRDVSQELQWIDMLAGGFGWGAGRTSIWRTNDFGQTWLDVTPPLPDSSARSGDRPDAAEIATAMAQADLPTPTPPASGDILAGETAIRQAFFLSRTVAWFLLQRPGQPDSLYATRDGGQSWQAAPLPFGDLLKSDAGEIELYFLNVDRGWAWVRAVSSAEDAPYGLFGTSDGGQTWQRLSVDGLQLSSYAPAHGPQLAFSDANRGWLVPSGLMPQLFATRDGGQSWEAQMLPLPDTLEWAPVSPLSAPYFDDGDYGPGVLPARVVERASGRELSIFFVSQDGGQSWRPSQPVAAASTYSIPAWHSLFVIPQSGGLRRSLDGGKSWQAGGSFRDAYGSGVQLRPQGIDFVGTEQGWAWQVRDGRLLLFTTTDGGDSWRRLDYAVPYINTVACRWQAADFKLPLIPLQEDGPYQGWGIYINPAHRFSVKVPPGWQLAEISYACLGDQRNVHRLVLRPPAGETPAMLTLAFRKPDQPVPLRDFSSLPAGLAVDGEAPFFWKQITRDVLRRDGEPAAIYYNEGREIQIGSEYVFTAALENNSPVQPGSALLPHTVDQAEQVLSSIEPLRADAGLLASMDVQTTFTQSPDGAWEVETLLAQPLQRSPVGYNYQRVVVTSQDGRRRWTALDQWVRSSGSVTLPTGKVWTPDGRWLYLYNSGITQICPLFNHDNGLRRLDLRSGEVQEIVLYPDNSLASLQISPDGSQVAYIPPDYLVNPRIILRSMQAERASPGVAGVEQEIVFDDPGIDHWGAGSLSWSPDGSRLVFALAGPYCAQQEEMRVVVLVDPQAGETRTLTAGDRWLTINKWLPDGRLRLADKNNQLFTLDVDSGELTAIPPDPPDRLAEAESTLIGYFMMLHNTWFDPGTYQWVAEHYGGSYDELLRLNPGADPQDKAGLFELACETNGYYCLRLRRVLDREIIQQNSANTLFRFTVELQKSDGSLFSLRGKTRFEYTIELHPSGVYLVMNLPPR